MIPLFAIYGLRLESTMDSYSNFVYDTTTNLTTGCTISEISLVNPNLDAASLLLNGGISYPCRPINVSANPSNSFLSFQKSLGSLNLVKFNGTMNKLSYYTGSTSCGLCSAYNATSTNILVYPNQWYFGVDCESVAHRGDLLSGISINQSSFFFRAIVGSQLNAYVHTLYFFVNHDVILQFDLNAKTVVSKY